MNNCQEAYKKCLILPQTDGKPQEGVHIDVVSNSIQGKIGYPCLALSLLVIAKSV